jgi:hypothetical protein
MLFRAEAGDLGLCFMGDYEVRWQISLSTMRPGCALVIRVLRPSAPGPTVSASTNVLTGLTVPEVHLHAVDEVPPRAQLPPVERAEIVDQECPWLAGRLSWRRTRLNWSYS